MNGPSELLIRQRLRALTRTVPEAQQGSAEAIHRARISTRRLREALPLVSGGAAGRKLQRRVRRLTRALGPVRELDVALQMLDEFERGEDVPRAGIACLRGIISAERQRVHEELVRSVGGVDLVKLSRKAVAAAQSCDARRSAGRGRDRTPPGAHQRAARRAGRLRGAMDSAAGMYLPDRLHDVRIAVKKLRYALEIVQAPAVARRARTSAGRATPARGAAAALRTLQRAQRLLGRMHDIEVLITRTRAVQGSSGAPNLRISGELDQFVRRLEMECRQLHAHYMALRPALAVIVADVTAKSRRGAAAA